MKIKISANSHLPHLEKVAQDISYGYASLNASEENLTEENSWSVKIISNMDKILGKITNLSSKQKEVTDHIVNVTQFLDSHIDSAPHLNNMSVNINVKSYLNTVLKTAFDIKHLFGKPKKIEGLPSLNDMAANIHTFNKRIVIGTNFFTKQHYFNLGYELKEKLGLEKAIGFVIYHEASHSFETTNNSLYSYEKELSGKSSYEVKQLIKIGRLCNLVNVLSNEKECDKNNLMLELTDNKELVPLNHDFINNIATLKSEIYADSGAILIQRNADILNGTYNKEDTTRYIDNIIDCRNRENQDSLIIHENDEHIYTSTFNHFTRCCLFKRQFKCFTR